jgi:hypothetical protein
MGIQIYQMISTTSSLTATNAVTLSFNGVDRQKASSAELLASRTLFRTFLVSWFARWTPELVFRVSVPTSSLMWVCAA